MASRGFAIKFISTDNTNPIILTFSTKGSTREMAVLVALRHVELRHESMPLGNLRLEDSMRGLMCNLINDGFLDPDGMTTTPKGKTAANDQLAS